LLYRSKRIHIGNVTHRPGWDVVFELVRANPSQIVTLLKVMSSAEKGGPLHLIPLSDIAAGSVTFGSPPPAMSTVSGQSGAAPTRTSDIVDIVIKMTAGILNDNMICY
jgi:hypothetical protein